MTPPGSVTLVTGGGSGIGAAVCRRLAVPGARLLLHAGQRRDRAEALADALRGAGATVAVEVADFGIPSRAAALVETALARWGELDRVVHAAGFADRRPLGVLDEAGFAASLATNATAFFHLATAALPALRRSAAPRIVAVDRSWPTGRGSGRKCCFPRRRQARRPWRRWCGRWRCNSRRSVSR